MLDIKRDSSILSLFNKPNMSNSLTIIYNCIEKDSLNDCNYDNPELKYNLSDSIFSENKVKQFK